MSSVSAAPQSVSATTNQGGIPARPSRPMSEDIILRNENPEGGRRREGSLSALTEISENQNNEISLATVKEPTAPTPMRRESFYTASEEDYLPRQKSRLGKIAFFSLIAIATAYGYRVVLEGGLPRMPLKVRAGIGK